MIMGYILAMIMPINGTNSFRNKFITEKNTHPFTVTAIGKKILFMYCK